MEGKKGLEINIGIGSGVYSVKDETGLAIYCTM